jgi:hypothetical protein
MVASVCFVFPIVFWCGLECVIGSVLCLVVVKVVVGVFVVLGVMVVCSGVVCVVWWHGFLFLVWGWGWRCGYRDKYVALLQGRFAVFFISLLFECALCIFMSY